MGFNSAPDWWTPDYLRKNIVPLIELYERLAMRERDGLVRNNDASKTPAELFPIGGRPDAAALGRIGGRCTGWHIMAVLALSGTDAGFQKLLVRLKLLVGDDPDNVLCGIDPCKIDEHDLYLAFCWVFYQCAPGLRTRAHARVASHARADTPRG